MVITSIPRKMLLVLETIPFAESTVYAVSQLLKKSLIDKTNPEAEQQVQSQTERLGIWCSGCTAQSSSAVFYLSLMEQVSLYDAARYLYILRLFRNTHWSHPRNRMVGFVRRFLWSRSHYLKRFMVETCGWQRPVDSPCSELLLGLSLLNLRQYVMAAKPGESVHACCHLLCTLKSCGELEVDHNDETRQKFMAALTRIGLTNVLEMNLSLN